MKQLLLFIFLIAFMSPVFTASATVDNIVVSNHFIDTIEDEFTLLTNPVKNGVLKLRVNRTTTKSVGITIINSLGEQVYNAKSGLNKQVLDFDVSKLAAGIYFLRIQSDSHSTVKKLIIQ
ncbi:T9SS type A sorting domain-containing protein [Nonlabens mediterrranea]|uniref:T9SS type A sorting domain-containing protein n=1 Tax=Nonlabens mediterrranea TaxID=1419947 RepID=A0ABS0A2M0_9FLAO|nr:T9SS type A sorting domain-containing protein [Nonlabens mediterrranea]